MRIVVCVKYVPVLAALRFDAATRRLVRDGVPGEVSGFDQRALGAATALRERHGGEVVVVTMGPPAATDGLLACLALGADRAVHVLDPALAGSDTLATARVLAAVVRRETPDLVLMGRASTDAETGQVGPEVAELLDLPQATTVRRLAIDPVARTFEAERETDDGFETVTGPLPALVTAAEDIAEERFPTKAARQAAAEKPIATLSLADLGVDAADVGTAGSPTWVAGVEQVEIARRAEVLESSGDAAEVVTRLHARLRELGALDAGGDDRPALPARSARDGAPIWVVVETVGARIRPVVLELLAKAAEFGAKLAAPVEAIVVGAGGTHAAALAAAGADRVLVADDPSLAPYTTDAHAAVLADAVRTHAPRLVLLGSTAIGRDLAPRVAGRLGLGLTGDAIDLELDADGRTRQMKPAFGGTIVAPILSRTRPEMATVRPGMLHAARPDATRPVLVDALAVRTVPARVRVVASASLGEESAAELDTARVVLGVGKGVGADAVASVVALARRIGAGIAATREVTDLGWLPRQHQVGLTGRAIAPRLYVGLGVSGAMEHMVGLRRAGTIVAVNKSPKAPVCKVADVTVLADVHGLLPHLETALRA